MTESQLIGAPGMPSKLSVPVQTILVSITSTHVLGVRSRRSGGNQYELNCYDYDRVRAELVEAVRVEAVRYWPHDRTRRTRDGHKADCTPVSIRAIPLWEFVLSRWGGASGGVPCGH